MWFVMNCVATDGPTSRLARAPIEGIRDCLLMGAQRMGSITITLLSFTILGVIVMSVDAGHRAKD